MKNIREMINLCEEEIDPSQVVIDTKPTTTQSSPEIDPSQVVIDTKPTTTQSSPEIDPSQVATTNQTTTASNTVKWPNTKDEVISFQQTHKQLDGKPLKPDGLIGPETLQALAKAGIQPPANFKMAKAKKPVSKPNVTPSPSWGSNADEQEIQSRIDQNKQYFNLSPEQRLSMAQTQQSIGDIPGMNGVPSSTVAANNTTPGPQSFGLGTQQPSKFDMQQIKEHVTFQQENSLARIIQLSRG